MTSSYLKIITLSLLFCSVEVACYSVNTKPADHHRQGMLMSRRSATFAAAVPFLIGVPTAALALDVDSFMQRELDNGTCNEKIDKKCKPKCKQAKDVQHNVCKRKLAKRREMQKSGQESIFSFVPKLLLVQAYNQRAYETVEPKRDYQRKQERWLYPQSQYCHFNSIELLHSLHPLQV